VSDGPELTPEDVQEILRLVDESGLDELELETPRFSLRVKRGDLAAAAGQQVPADGLAEVTAPTVGTSGTRGTIAEVCVENAAPVQYGDVLFRVRPL
jgi:hypothetical protein